MIPRGVVRGHKNPLHFGLPSRLRQARKTAGLTRKAVVQNARAGQSAMRDIEADQRLPTVATISRLASALGVTAPWLAYGLGAPSSEGPAADTDGMGARLQRVRLERAVTKAELGRLAGLTAPSITQIENGGSSGVHVVEALAQALGISPGWLAYGVGDKELPPSRRGRPPAQAADPEP